MRILLVTPMLPREDGTGAIPLLLHAQLLGLRQHHEVTLVSAVGDEPGETEAAERLRASGVDAHLADRRQPPSVAGRWRRRMRLAGAWLGGRPWRAAWFADPGVQPILDRLADTRDFDVVAVEDSAMSGYRLPTGAASVLTEHEVLRPRSIYWNPGRPAEWPGWALEELDWRRRPPFQRAAWERFERVLAFGKRDAGAIAELAPGLAARVRVSPFGLELPDLTDVARQLPGLVLFTGNFSHRPNRDAATWLVEKIMPGVRERHPEARLRIVGSQPPPEILGLSGPDVDVVADAPDIGPHMEEATVVIAPVRTGGGMRMKVLQALAAGKAVVTTSRGAEGFDCFEAPPPLLLADAPEQLARQTAALLADPSRRSELGGRARAFAEEHHSPSAWAMRLEAIYEEAVDGAR